MPGALILINGFPGVGKHTVAAELVKLLPNCRFFDTRSLQSAASQLHEPNDPAHALLRKNLVSDSLDRGISESCGNGTEHMIVAVTQAGEQAVGPTVFDQLFGPTGRRLRSVSPSRTQSPNTQKHAIFDSIAQTYTATSPTGPAPPTYVLTDFLSVAGKASDLAMMHEFIAFAQRSGFAFVHIILSCALEQNVERLTSPQRLEAKRVPGGSVICTDADTLTQIRMEEEIGHVAPLKGLCGEYEIDTTRLDAKTAAGILAEYCLDTLRNEGWWIQLKSMARPAVSVKVRGSKP